MLSDWIVTYDICEPKRLRLVFRIMKGYGDHLQYSVFRCALDRTRLALLKHALLEVINEWEDQVLFVYLGPLNEQSRKKRRVRSIGRPMSIPPSREVPIF
ncbi:MAG: CRISPR-associated endonuclease Cas2 [Candidatus Eremiobacterota bacterium]